MGMSLFLLLNGLMAQEEIRRTVRGSQTKKTPGSVEGTDPLGEDPTRAELGRPDPHGGAGEPVEPEVDDPFMNENGGAGVIKEPEVDDPFKNENGGAGEPGKEKPTVQGMPARRPNRSNK